MWASDLKALLVHSIKCLLLEVKKKQFILLYLAVFVTIKILINTILVFLYLSSLRRMFSQNLFFTHIKQFHTIPVVSYYTCVCSYENIKLVLIKFL